MRIESFYMRIYAGIAFLLLFTLVIHSVIYSQKMKSDMPIVWKETIGTLPFHGYSQGTINYEVNGETYTGVFTPRNDRAVKGEKYTMRYNVDNPKEIEVDYWHPVFLEGEKRYPFKATVKKIHKKSFWDPTPFVVYTFDIKEIHVERYVYLPPNYKQLYPNLTEGEHYEVECWAENADRIVLHLDKPLKDTTNAK
jgi:hypothetical protein